jgi:hypothetical protein
MRRAILNAFACFLPVDFSFPFARDSGVREIDSHSRLIVIDLVDFLEAHFLDKFRIAD